MAGNRNGTADASGKPRTSAPRLRELLGDFDEFPVFRDMAAACERATDVRSLAWPMSIPFPVEPPRQADFAQLAALYCNHLGYLLMAERGARRDDASVSFGGYATLFAFFAHALSCYATALPAGVAAEFENIARSKLLASMKAARRDDAFWHAAEQEAERRLTALGRQAKSSSSIKLTEALIGLPALHGAAAGVPANTARHLSALYTDFEIATRP